MRIPTSVIVMSVVTAVPFGLAIRDTLHGHPKDDAFDYDRDASRERVLREAEERADRQAELELERERADAEARRDAVIPRLVGTAPASLGSLFRGLTLGAPAGSFQPEGTRQAIQEVADVASVSFDVDAISLNAVEITLDDGCEKLAQRLRTVWGPADHGRWADPVAHRRASLDEDACLLHVERYADVETWLGKDATSIVPLDLLHKPEAALRERLAARLLGDEDTSIAWDDLGTGGGQGRTHLAATFAHGKVVGLTASQDGGLLTYHLLRDRVTAILGHEPEEDVENDAYVWTGRIPARLTLGEDDVTLELGAP